MWLENWWNSYEVLEKKDPKTEVLKDTKWALSAEKTEFEEFKEVMKIKDSISKRISSISDKINSLEWIPSAIKEKINNTELQNLLNSNIYELEDVKEKREALEFMDSFLWEVDLVLDKAWENWELNFSDIKILTDKLESKFDDLKWFIRLENWEFEHLNTIITSTMIVSVIAFTVIWRVTIPEIGLFFIGVIWVAAARFFTWKTWGEKIYENLDVEFWKSFLMDKIDDYIPSENISKYDFEKLYELLEENLWVYKSKEKIVNQTWTKITPDWISFSWYIEWLLKGFLKENPDVSNEEKLEKFTNYIKILNIKK